MQDLLKKIIEMDEQARKIELQAKAERIKSEEEVEQLKEQIYNDYIVRAKARIEKNIAVDKERSDKELKAYEQKVDATKQEMERLYDEKKEIWVKEIVSRSLE